MAPGDPAIPTRRSPPETSPANKSAKGVTTSDASQSVPELLAIAVAELGGSERQRPTGDGHRGRAVFRDRRAPCRAGRDRHRQVAGVPGSRNRARGQRRHAGRGVDGDDRPAASTRRSRPAPAGRFTHRRTAPPAAVRLAQRSTKLPVPEQDSQRQRRRAGRRRCSRRRNSSTRWRSPRSGRDVQRLTAWASTTDSGDRDDLKPGVPDRSWSQVSVSARECIGVARCPYGSECFSERARGRAGAADVVVTNHALLAIDAVAESAVLPEHSLLVVDEAHELVDRVTSVATAELTSATLGVAARRITRLVNPELTRATGGHVGHLRRRRSMTRRPAASIISTTRWRPT